MGQCFTIHSVYVIHLHSKKNSAEMMSYTGTLLFLFSHSFSPSIFLVLRLLVAKRFKSLVFICSSPLTWADYQSHMYSNFSTIPFFRSFSLFHYFSHTFLGVNLPDRLVILLTVWTHIRIKSISLYSVQCDYCWNSVIFLHILFTVTVFVIFYKSFKF